LGDPSLEVSEQRPPQLAASFLISVYSVLACFDPWWLDFEIGSRVFEKMCNFEQTRGRTLLKHAASTDCDPAPGIGD
jgi:hypothetical protein